MQRALVILALLAVAAGLFWRFPLFHIVRLDDLQASKQETAFDAAAFAKEFWNERLVPSLSEAPDATIVLAKFAEDPKAAREQFGRKVGVSRTTLLVLRGKGTVTYVDDKGVGVSLTEDKSTPDVVLHTGLLFGNVARDATGLLNTNDFANSRQFNEISVELNRIVETQVIPALKAGAEAGETLQFVGCAEASDTASDVRPLTVIPLEVRFE